jgi:hypothetical protein
LSVSLRSLSDHRELIPSAVFENADNIPGVTRYEPIPICCAAVESQSKIKGLSNSITPADYARSEPVRAIRVTQLVNYLSTLNVAKCSGVAYGSEAIALALSSNPVGSSVSRANQMTRISSRNRRWASLFDGSPGQRVAQSPNG